MKKFWIVMMTLIAALCLCFGLTACGEKDAPVGGQNNNTQTEQPGGDTPSGDEPSGGEQDEQPDDDDTDPDDGPHPGGEEGTAGLNYALNPDRQSYTLRDVGSAEDCDIVIPDLHNGLPVTTIAGGDGFFTVGAFGGQAWIVSISIGRNITSIESGAFSGCSGLTAVHITDLAAWCKIDFGDNPLAYAHHLYLDGNEIKDLVIPDEITEIKDRVFQGCTGLTSITIPDSVTSIGYEAFRNCSGLTSITIPDSVTSIENYVFNRIRDTAKNQKILLKQSLSRA